MRLLIITQKVDSEDPILGFFHSWIEKFSLRFESVLVICLQKGKFDLPKNVQVFSLGKEKNLSKISYIFNFYKLIWKHRKEYDSVFVHMNQIYVVLGGLLWRAWHKKIALWYVHRQTSVSLWIATKLVDNIFTSSPQSFKIKSQKVIYVGHGVDSSQFISPSHREENKINILHVGRITPIKNLETLISATEILNKKASNFMTTFVGEATSEGDLKYFDKLKSMIKAKNLEKVITFKGKVPNTKIQEVYYRANLSVNLTPEGGWDKSVIESIMAKCPVFASNLALLPVFGEYKNSFIFEYQNPEDLASKIEIFLADTNRDVIMENLQREVVKKFDLNILIQKISDNLNK